MRSAILLATSCSCILISCARERPIRAEVRESDYKLGPYYFKKAEKVDNTQFGPNMYRLENDEVICYSGGSEQGLQCRWKVQQ